MPARSKAQRRLMAIAEHHPEMLRKENRGVLSMGKKKLHEFAATKEKRLPERKERKESTASFIKRRNRKEGK